MKRYRDGDQNSLLIMDIEKEAPNKTLLSSDSSSSSKNHVLLSTSILFRHGARGPGKSEVVPWDKTNLVVSQWKENEFEQLSTVGLQQMNSLGTFFAHRCEKLQLKAPTIENYRFYASKEKRAKFSGDEFVASFLKSFNKQGKLTNDENENNKTSSSTDVPINKSMPDTPLPMDPDYYFRPWKIYTDVDRAIKTKRDSAFPASTSISTSTNATDDRSSVIIPLLAQSSSTLSLSSLSQYQLQTTEISTIDTSSLSEPDTLWHEKVTEHEEVLTRIGKALQMKSSIANHPHLVLWSTTHIQCLLTCEKDWQHQQPQIKLPLPSSSSSSSSSQTDETNTFGVHNSSSSSCSNTSNSRNALRQLMSVELERPVLELACWVWQQRFTQSGYQVDLGGWMLLMLIQQTFDLSNSSNIVMCAGHDYTVLCMLSAAGVLSTLAAPLKFGCYVVFELWGEKLEEEKREVESNTIDGATIEKKVCLESSSSSESSSNKVVAEGPVLKIICNFQPFDYTCNNNSINSNNNTSPSLPPVHDEREVVMATINMHELRLRIESVCATLIAHRRCLPPGYSMPPFILQHTRNIINNDNINNNYNNTNNTDAITSAHRDKNAYNNSHDNVNNNVVTGVEVKTGLHSSGDSGSGREGGTGGDRTEVETETEVTSVSVGDTYSKCTSFASNKSSSNNNAGKSGGVDIAQILTRMDSDKSSAATLTGTAADAVPLTSHDQLQPPQSQSQSQKKSISSRRNQQQTEVTDCCGHRCCSIDDG